MLASANHGSPGDGGAPPAPERTAVSYTARAGCYAPWILPPPARRLIAGGGAPARAPAGAEAGFGAAEAHGAAAAAGEEAPPPPPPPRMLLFCIPQAGMGAWVYHAWEEHLAPRGVEVLSIELPGHNSRMREPPATDLIQLAADIANVVRQVLHDRGGRMPYALFGHSMGAWIAYEVVQDLMRSDSPLPVHLFVSGCRAPHLFSAGDDLDPTRLHKLGSPEEFWVAFEARYGTANPHLANPRFRQLMWPILRADFSLVETYQLPAGNRPVPVPTTVFGGEVDQRYTREQIHAWSQHLAGPSSAFVWIPGAGHDYVERANPLLLAALGDTLGTVA